MILDTSALLAVLFNEEHGPRVLSAMKTAPSLSMSAVNLCETLVLAADRKRIEVGVVFSVLEPFAIDYVEPDTATAVLAAGARLRLPLNFGDCFAYALAKLRHDSLLTLDGDFAKTDVSLAAY